MLLSTGRRKQLSAVISHVDFIGVAVYWIRAEFLPCLWGYWLNQ